MWSYSTKCIVLVELTCPAEENIQGAAIYKRSRYFNLVEELREKGWKVDLFTVEAGARGFIAQSMSRCLQKIGIAKRSIKTMCRKLSEVVARCSYAIWLARNSKSWAHRVLLRPGDIQYTGYITDG